MEISRTPLGAVNRLFRGTAAQRPNRGVFAAELPGGRPGNLHVRALWKVCRQLAAGNIRPEAVARMERILARQYEMVENRT